MTYELVFLTSAKKEWDKLDPSLKSQFKKKLLTRLEDPHVLKDRLSILPDCYKIKLRASGYRLVYRVFDDRIVVQVVTIGKRDKFSVYKNAAQRVH